jgi:predicted nucleotidyltransferase
MVRLSPSIESELQQVVRRLVDVLDPEKIVLFGSYAYGTPHRDSDFDLLIIQDAKEPPRERRFKVRKTIWPLPIKTSVEPFVFTQAELDTRLNMGDQFVKEIIEHGMTLYERRLTLPA